jgi:GT2 family glycosyltransferase
MGDAHYTFCTLFDRNYLFRGVALYRSLERWAGDFTLDILCMDDASHDALARLGLPKARLIRLSEFEDSELRKAKATRSTIEYFWTCTPSLPLFVMHRDPNAELVTYLDADLLFYADPKPLFDEMGSASIMIHEHRFPARLAHLAVNGIYNVGWVTFRRDERGLACARRWREQCNEWCFYRPEEGRLGDQKYLDTWTREHEGVHVLRHKGGGLAPWNIEQYAVHKRADGRVFVDDDPLVFYHFHGLRMFDDGSVLRAPSTYPLRNSDVELIYDPYVRALAAARQEVQRAVPGYVFGLERPDARSAKDELVDMRRDATVHVLIPVHNRLEFTRQCLSCFARQDYAHINVIVIDDGSTDGTSEMLAREFPNVTVLRGNGNLWWTGAMWRGVRHVLQRARAEDFVLCINNDTTFEPDYVSTLVRVSRGHGGALVGSLLRSWTDRSLISIGPRIKWWKADVFEIANTVDDPERLAAQETIDTLDALSGRGTLIPVRVFRRVGNFRRRLLPHYIADYEFSARAKRRGEKLVLSTRAAVYPAPDAPPTRPAPDESLRGTLRAMFSRRSNVNVIDHLVFYAVSGPPRDRPYALVKVLRGALASLGHAVSNAWRGRKRAAAADAAAGSD